MKNFLERRRYSADSPHFWYILCTVSLSSSPSTTTSHHFRPLFTVPLYSSPFSATLHRSPLLFIVFSHTITGHATTVTTRHHYLFHELRVGSCSSILHLFSNFLLVSIPSKVMSQRKKGSLASSSKGGKRFVDEKAQKCFRDLYSLSTTIISERGLLITEGLPAYGHLHYLINKIGWGDYVKPPPFKGIQGLVQEFYANLCSRDEDGKVFIRDRWFKISRDVIRELLFLPDIPTTECEYHRMTTQGFTEEEYDAVLIKLYNPEDWPKQWELHHRTKERLSLDMTYLSLRPKSGSDLLQVTSSHPLILLSLRSGSKRRKRKSNSANESGSEPDDHFEELVQQEAGALSSAPPQHTGVLDPWLHEYLEWQAAIQAVNHQELLAMQAAH
ncbi:uncharacterized protein G2W53_007983 [Senna tora]|uniref:Uncharacterized protein n=1 Tax=Senna tora TaxID=362788 RepID=A0A835CE85_9FABA|nr:uncharacterized protein G2W53_007983 [Senna tora]